MATKTIIIPIEPKSFGLNNRARKRLDKNIINVYPNFSTALHTIPEIVFSFKPVI